MLSTSLKTRLALGLLALLTLSEEVLARTRWMERDGRALYLRRFGEEHPAVIDKLSSACGGGICTTLAGQAITPLLAAQPECSQQDMADQIIAIFVMLDTAQQFDAATKASMIALAQEYRQAEKNTPPDFTVTPNINRNSVFCQTAPKNPELDGLVQAQDPANDPNVFFDPAANASVKKGAQANTFPFGINSSTTPTASPSSPVTVSFTVSSIPSAKPTGGSNDLEATDPSPISFCPPAITVTVTGAINPLPTGPAVTVTVGSSIPLIPAPTSTASAVGNFGSCTLPQIEFGVGFDNRTETSFEPVDQTSYNHGSAQNIDIITQFICDTLVNTCGADQTAQNTCATAKAAADQFPPKTGAQADAFNAVFGISTSFAQVAAVDDQGNVIAGSTSGATVSSAAPSSVIASATITASAAAQTTQVSAGSASTGIGNFGNCSVPQIEFATGFDGRKETSFQPTDKTSYNHGSTQNIDIITQFICDALTNSCKADQTAQDTCAKATMAADGQAAETGAQADAFNAVFGITTDFASVAVVDDQGRVVSAWSTAQNVSTTVAPPALTAAVSIKSSTAPPSAATSAAVISKGANLQTFAGALGNVTSPPVTQLANGQFQVTGNSAFNTLSDALTRSCDVQHNQCANAANAAGNKGDLTVTACGDQQTQCDASR
ncbi:hypothetical protein EUX98_g980 [Antrodiella citrinella]|uniref:Uncharacterized protein n=1 Tax=Antrodiella citrinella TaxID=2447956 RepID=A0A4V3XJJ1_9APHY|nr:hypothetical protein EUX98_g980 [Antrodiella citrinella]